MEQVEQVEQEMVVREMVVREKVEQVEDLISLVILQMTTKVFQFDDETEIQSQVAHDILLPSVVP
jgi:hypothetical protein